jgi:alkyl sulfatase BDS1-like metallo-beta-lactamase superfamily hydrolase
MTVNFRFPDTSEAWGIEIRRGVAQFIEHAPRKADLTLTLDKAVLDRIRLGQLTMSEAIAANSAVATDGPQTDVERFFNYFEVPFGTPIQLVVR